MDKKKWLKHETFLNQLYIWPKIQWNNFNSIFQYCSLKLYDTSSKEMALLGISKQLRKFVQCLNWSAEQKPKFLLVIKIPSWVFWCSIFSCTSFNGEAHSYLQEARLLACSEGAALPREQRLFLWQMFRCHLWILLQWEIGEMKIWSQQACNTYLSSLAKFLHYRLTCSSLGSRQNASRSIFFTSYSLSLATKMITLRVLH